MRLQQHTVPCRTSAASRVPPVFLCVAHTPRGRSGTRATSYPSAQAETRQQQQQQQLAPLVERGGESKELPPSPRPVAAAASSVVAPRVQQQPRRPLRAEDAWAAFEEQLEADLITTGTTLVAILGVICFWRGVWSLLVFYIGDNPIGDLSCVLAGFAIILGIRLSGLKVGSFWPSG